MDPLTHEEWRERALAEAYWRKRWAYSSRAVLLTLRYMPRDGRGILEVGSLGSPLFKGSDSLDYLEGLSQSQAARLPKPTFDLDLRTPDPWPIPDKAYGALIALQVWEHLEGSQGRAFLEARRVSEVVILSIPYKWPTDKPPGHKGLHEGTLLQWTGLTPTHLEVVDGIFLLAVYTPGSKPA